MGIFLCIVMAVVYAFSGITMKLITDTAIEGAVSDVLPIALFVIGYFLLRFLAELCLNIRFWVAQKASAALIDKMADYVAWKCARRRNI